MKGFKGIFFLAALGSLLPMSAWGASTPYTAGAGITGTPHDFVGSTTTPTYGLCTFCHTPHKAYMTKLLWNHTLSTASGFTWQDVTATTAGTTYASIANNQATPSSTWMGPTTRCLSCHDGSVAIGDVAWFNASTHTGSNNLNNTHVSGDYNVGNTGGTVGNMSGNHPVAMPFPFNQTASTYNGTTTGDQAYLDEWVLDPREKNQTHIRLFKQVATNDVVAGAAVGTTGIECSTCHDPHNKKTVAYSNASGVTEARFYLRGRLVGADAASGYICLQCHIK